MPPLTDPTLDALLAGLAAQPGTLVSVQRTQGSVPREAGTWMAVWPQRVLGTIGGGHLEFDAIAHARRLLAGDAVDAERRFARVEPSSAEALVARLQAAHDARRMPVALFGGGHVGRAIVQALRPLPVRVHWIDSRDEVFPEDLPPQVRTEHSAPVEAAVRDLDAATRVLVMSFSHAEDLAIVAACLQRLRERDDLPFVGLIGSRSKWAAFTHRLQARGFADSEIARITCPIGVPGVVGKEPEVIAAAVAAQLMQLR
jgi:xanthine dehydrogenase accessory factor